MKADANHLFRNKRFESNKEKLVYNNLRFLNIKVLEKWEVIRCEAQVDCRASD